jgi:hypothetical protein
MRVKRRIILGALLAAPIGLAAWIGFVEADAEAKARAFCEHFPPGSLLMDVEAAARNEGDSRHRTIRGSEISIAYIGVPPFSRHMCIFEGQFGKVTKSRYIHID